MPAIPSPKPTRRYLEENGLQPKKPKGRKSTEDNADGLFFTEGLLAPTRQGSYAVTKHIEVQRGIARATSHQGIVEELSDDPDYKVEEEEHDPQPTTSPEAGLGVMVPDLDTAQYTPSIYEGIWSNNANVVSSRLYIKVLTV